MPPSLWVATTEMRRYKQTYADLMFNIDKTFATDWRITAPISVPASMTITFRALGMGGRLKSIPNLFSAP